MLIGMALGVAVVFAVDIANESAKRAFALSLDTVTGRATHRIVGGTDGLDENIYTALRTEMAIRASSPIVEGSVTIVGNPATDNFPNTDNGPNTDSDPYTETLQLLGVDLFAEPMFRDISVTVSEDTSIRSSLALLQPGAVILASTTAQRLGVQVGSKITLKETSTKETSTGTRGNALPPLQLISTVDTNEQPGFESIAMVDIATAQNILGMQGKLSRIDLILPVQKLFTEDSDNKIDKGQFGQAKQNQIDRDISAITQSFKGVRIESAERQSNSLIQMTQAFHTNLFAMSLLALLVGAFLIYNTVTLSVIQRRPLFGQLRVVGITRGELFGSVMIETLVFAVLGTAAGLLLGYLLGSALLTLVTRTINDLYFTLDVRQVSYSGLTLIKSVCIGLGVSLLAALPPSIEAAHSPPVTVTQRSTMERRVNRLVPKLFFAGVMLAITGFAILRFDTSSLWAGFVALFFVVIGYSLIIPQLLVTMTSLTKRAKKKPAQSTRTNKSTDVVRSANKLNTGKLGFYPIRSMTASLSRTSVAIAALVVAVSATAGVGIMIGSFRLSVSDWLSNTLQSDIYIRNANINDTLPTQLIDDISGIKNIAGLRQARMIDIETDYAPARLMAASTKGKENSTYVFREEINLPRNSDRSNNRELPDSIERLRQLRTSQSVLVSEPFATKNSLRVDDSVRITTRQGVVAFTIAGIFADYTTGKGFMVMSLEQYQQHWNDTEVSSIGLTLSPGTDVKNTLTTLRPILANYPNELLMRSNTDIKQQSLEIFDRTFAITHILRLLTIGVAFIGILSALMALSLERKAEFAVLRALGITPSELRNLLFTQTALMGLIAGCLALPLGIVMSKILVSVINLRSFGWTMEFYIPAVVLLESILLALVAALIAGWYPARKLSQLSPAEALRHQ